MRVAKTVASVAWILSSIGLLVSCGGGNGGEPQVSRQLSPGLSRNAASVPQLGARNDGQRGSWMAPDAKGHDLLYVSDLNNNAVNVYSYPNGTLKGVLTGFNAPHYECVDTAGNVFVANGGANQLLEYAHGGKTPIKTFNEPGFTHGCAIDPTTGNLAVLHDPSSSGPGGFSLYAHAQGKPKEYTTPNVFRVSFIGYDAQGNLFVDGSAYHLMFEIAELTAGGKTARAVTLNEGIALPGAIQWDGRHLDIGDQVSISGPSKIDQFSMKGTVGTLVGTTPLANSCDVLQFWIHGKRVVAGNDCASQVLYFKYPRGGTSIKTIGDSLSQPIGVTISPK
jgi:hypothetical protein